METKTNRNLKFKVPYDINDAELSNRFKANNENLIEKIKILIWFELKTKLSLCNYWNKFNEHRK